MDDGPNADEHDLRNRSWEQVVGSEVCEIVTTAKFRSPRGCLNEFVEAEKLEPGDTRFLWNSICGLGLAISQAVTISPASVATPACSTFLGSSRALLASVDWSNQKFVDTGGQHAKIRENVNTIQASDDSSAGASLGAFRRRVCLHPDPSSLLAINQSLKARPKARRIRKE